MYYITAYKRTAPVEGHTDPLTVLGVLNENKSHKITFEVASPSMLRIVPNTVYDSLYYMLRAKGCMVMHSAEGARLITQSDGNRIVQAITIGAHREHHTPKTDSYQTFRIPKRSGGFREIKAPHNGLKKAQKAVYKYFSEDLKILEHECAYGFVKGRNCKASLEVHKEKGSRWFLKLDFHNFFPSFSTELLKRQLLRNAAIAKYHPTDLEHYLYVCTDEYGNLVQGSPCSPYLANIAMIPFDQAFYKYCNEHQLVYTRYADDMLISSNRKFNWHEVVGVVLELLDNLGYSGLSLSADKTRFGSFNGANWNLGLMYNNQFDITVGHRNKRLFKVIAHKWNELTPEDQVHWRGVFNYYRYIEPEYFAQERFNVCWQN